MADLRKQKQKRLTRKHALVLVAAFAAVYLIAVTIWGALMDPQAYAVSFSEKFVAPNAQHIFGTDNMGRDMFHRCIKGLSISLIIGVVASVVSSILALIFGILSAVFGGWIDKFVNLCVDLCMGLPHMVLLILISFMMGKGIQGVAIAVALTHWPSLTRLVREEVMQVRASQYVQAAYKMGQSRFKVAVTHIVPHVLPVYLIGLILLFPHAIMHEAALTFLGFGLPREVPAIGGILSEAMTYIVNGNWWLAAFPGLMLLIAVVLFDAIGDNLKKLWNPTSGNM